MLNTASQEFLNTNMGDIAAADGGGLNRAPTGQGPLENIKEEVYVSKNGAIEPGNMHLQDHNIATVNSPLVISPTSSSAVRK